MMEDTAMTSYTRYPIRANHSAESPTRMTGHWSFKNNLPNTIKTSVTLLPKDRKVYTQTDIPVAPPSYKRENLNDTEVSHSEVFMEAVMSCPLKCPGNQGYWIRFLTKVVFLKH